MDVSSITVKGIETACADQGAGGALLCIHGWGANLGYWRKLWPKIVPRFRSLAPDLPGFGLSGKPGDAPYTIEWYVEWIAALLDAKRVTSAVVVGHSMGGQVAAMFAAAYPERVRRLVLLNPVIQGSTALFPRPRLVMKPFIRRFFFTAARSTAFLRWASRDFVSSRPMEVEDLRSIQRATFRSITRSFGSLTTTDVLGVASRIQAPTLVINSAEDRIIHPEQGAMLAKAVPGAKRLVLPDAGHCAQLEMPERFNAALLGFVEDVPRPVRPRQW